MKARSSFDYYELAERWRETQKTALPPVFSILTDENPVVEKALKNKTLRELLDAEGIGYQLVDGCYNGQTERSYLIPNIKQAHADM